MSIVGKVRKALFYQLILIEYREAVNRSLLFAGPTKELPKPTAQC